MRKVADMALMAALTAFALIGHGEETKIGEALKWWTMAAEKGYMPAQNALAMSFLLNKEVENQAKGLNWLQIAASNGSEQSQGLLKFYKNLGKIK